MKISSQTNKVTGKGDLLLSAILRTSQTRAPNFKNKLQIDQNTQYSTYYSLTSSIKNFDLKTAYDSSSSATNKFLQHQKPPLLNEMKKNQMISPYPPVIDLKIPTKQLLKKESSLCLRNTPELSSADNISSGSMEMRQSSSSERTSGGFCSTVDQFRTKQCSKKDDFSKCQDEVAELLSDQLKQCDLNKNVEVRTFRNELYLPYY